MRAEEITPEILDEIVLEILNSKTGFEMVFPMVKTDDIAKVLWSEHRVPIWKQRGTVKEKIKDWWETKPTHRKPRYHKFIGTIAVHTASPMKPTYSTLDRIGRYAIIVMYRNQDEFKGSN